MAQRVRAPDPKPNQCPRSGDLGSRSRLGGRLTVRKFPGLNVFLLLMLFTDSCCCSVVSVQQDTHKKVERLDTVRAVVLEIGTAGSVSLNSNIHRKSGHPVSLISNLGSPKNFLFATPGGRGGQIQIPLISIPLLISIPQPGIQLPAKSCDATYMCRGLGRPCTVHL